MQEQCPPKKLFLTWMCMSAMIQQRNEVVNQRCSDLQVRLSADGFQIIALSIRLMKTPFIALGESLCITVV